MSLLTINMSAAKGCDPILIPGPKGDTGVGIMVIVDNMDGTFTIFLSDNSSYIITLPQAVPGVDGVDGINGTNGIDGINGTNGTNGVDGKDGIDGTNGKDGVGTEGIAGTEGSNGKMPWYYWLVWPAGAVGTGGAYVFGRKSVKQTPA
jgi:hypothetical protein